MSDLATKLTKAEREQRWKNQRPRDASTVLLLEKRGGVAHVLLGRRHDRHRFLPGKYVFPGGRVDRGDGFVKAVGELDPRVGDKLLSGMKRGAGAHRARALALAAVREVFEETGIAIGLPAQSLKTTNPDWRAFFDLGLAPDLSVLRFVGRAITPPRRPRRFDTRFFAVDIDRCAHSTDAVMTPSEELEELVWMPLAEAATLDIPTITSVILEELQTRLKTDPLLDPATPSPYFHMVRGAFIRETV